VSIGVSVEIAIVSVLREVIVSGVLETDWHQVLAVCLFLATAALLLVVRVLLPPTFAGVDPEARVSARFRSSLDNAIKTATPDHPAWHERADQHLSTRAVRSGDEALLPIPV
jgi:hypothetical protein